MNSIATIFLSVSLSAIISWLMTFCGCCIHAKGTDKVIDDFLKKSEKICKETIQKVNQEYKL